MYVEIMQSLLNSVGFSLNSSEKDCSNCKNKYYRERPSKKSPFKPFLPDEIDILPNDLLGLWSMLNLYIFRSFSKGSFEVILCEF